MGTGLTLEMLFESQFSIQGMPFNLNLTRTTSHRSFYTCKNNYKVLLSKITNN